MLDKRAAVASWRNELEIGGKLSKEDIDELESHLEEEMDALGARGFSSEEALVLTRWRLGETQALTQEYAKVSRWSRWRQPVMWMLIGAFASHVGMSLLTMACNAALALGASGGAGVGFLTTVLWGLTVGIPLLFLGFFGYWLRGAPKGRLTIAPRWRRALAVASIAGGGVVLVAANFLPGVLAAAAFQRIGAPAYRALMEAWQLAFVGLAVAMVGLMLALRSRMAFKAEEASRE